MRNDFGLIYLGESLEAYVDIASSQAWEKSAIASEEFDRNSSDLLILSEKDLEKLKKLSKDYVLTSYLKGLEVFQPLSFILNVNGKRILLGRSEKENIQELERFSFLEDLSSKKVGKILENALHALFWNQSLNSNELLMQPYYWAKKTDVLPFFKDSYGQNNGTYIIGDLEEVKLKKPQTVTFSSLWGKCSVEDFKIDTYSRLEGIHRYKFKTPYPRYERTRIEIKLESSSVLPHLFVDFKLKDQWIPFAFLNVQSNHLILDLYTLDNGTTKRGYREKIAKGFLAKVNRELSLEFAADASPLIFHHTFYTKEAEQEFSGHSPLRRIKIN